MHIIAKTAVATLIFAGLHSALATRAAKAMAARRYGTARSQACYRVFYVAQGLLTFAALTAYCASLPRQTMYRVRGPLAWTMRAVQAAGLLPLVTGLRTVGLRRWSGTDSLQAWRAGRPLPPPPAAQGPELAGDGRLDAGGPFRYCRHPLNFAGLPLFWLTPHMTTRRFGFNLVGSAYLVLGSLHEEARLRAAWGEQYGCYLGSGVPFFWPASRPVGLLPAAARREPH